MKQADRCCVDCTYFDKDEEECHKLPPGLYVKTDIVRVKDVTHTKQDETVTLWPSVAHTDWCGDFEPEQTDAGIPTALKELNDEERDAMHRSLSDNTPDLSLFEPEPEPEPEKTSLFQDGVDYLKSFGKKDK